MKRKIITAGTSFAIPVVTICLLYLLNPIVSLLKIDSKYNQLLLAIIATPLAILISYLFDSSTKESLIPNNKTLKKTFSGLLIGIFITLGMLTILLYSSEVKLKLNPNTNYAEAFTWCLIFFPLAFFEELIFRGQAFVKTKNVLGIRTTQVIFALVFAFYHDPTGVTFGSQLLGPGIWAFIYGWAAIKSGGIAFPTGIHAGINIVQAVFGMKENIYAIGELYYEDTITSELQNKTELIGLAMQVVILIIGILLTEKVRNKKTNL